MKALRIISKKPGFRRAGIAHPDQPMVYPADRFTDVEIASLEAERNLIVDRFDIPGDVEIPDGGIAEAELKAKAEAAEKKAPAASKK